MARSVGKGVLSFGLVNIPVKLFSTGNSSSRVSFNLMSKSGNRLKQQYIDPTNDEVVPNDSQIRGYEYAKGQYVLFEPDELKALSEASSPNIGIEEFVPAARVPSLYVEKTYYLVPDNGGAKAYALLARALKETGRVGLARWAARGKQHLVMVAPYEDGLAFHQLLYADEVVPFSDVRVAPEKVTDQELELAKMLVNQIASPDFEPEKYSDAVKERMERAIEAKINGLEVAIPEPEAPKDQTLDLLAALKASLSAPPA